MIFVGDLHGGYPALLDTIGKKRITDECIIQVGDWGIEQEKNAGRDLRAALLAERKQMETVLSHTKTAGLKEWYYGHYHESVAEQIDGITFRCLDIGERYSRP